MQRRSFAPVMLALLAPLLLGLAACAPYPMAAAYHPAAPRVFHVYFAFGNTGLTGQDQAQLQSVAAYANARPGSRIRIVGHADAPGAPEGNAAISQRRSMNVADTLTQYGVGRERMRLEAYGEGRPAVITNPGGMQPENRRVDIVIY